MIRHLRCSFCRKKDAEVQKLVAGPRVYICDACVAIATELMNTPPADDHPPRVHVSTWHKLVAIVEHMVRGDHKRSVFHPSVS